MSLRIRLVVAFFLLSVVPLGAVTYYSYTSHVRVLREAAEHEADLLTSELGRQMQLVTAQLRQRVEHLVDLAALQQTFDAAETERQQAAVARIDVEIANSLGEAAMLLNNVEIRGRGRRGGRPPGASADPEGRAARPQVPRFRPVEGDEQDRPAIRPTDDPAAPIRIDMGAVRRAMLRELMPEGQEGQLTAEERQRVFLEVRQRMEGIREGLELGAQALEERAQAAQRAADTVAVTAPVAPTSPAPTVAAAPPTEVVRTVSLSGDRLDVSIASGGEVVQGVSAEINLPNLLATVFATSHREEGEVPFAIGADDTIYTQTPEDRAVVERLGLVSADADSLRRDNWIVVSMDDPAGSGLRLGFARPLSDSMAELRRTAVSNAALGLLFIGLALVVIVPLSSGLTRNLGVLTHGVRRIAAGEYQTRVDVASRDEVGELAQAFNQMAADIETHQRTAIERDRLRRELELGRQIQLQMLPQEPLKVGATEVRGVSMPAREVGGDFFNYFPLADGRLALVVGDVSGKGVGAALLMAKVQTLLRARLGSRRALASIADRIDADVGAGSPDAVYVTLFMGILDPTTRRLRYVNAGHHPQYVLRASGAVELMASTGLPAGLRLGREYAEGEVQLAPGDVLFFYTDGCLDAENAQGEMFEVDRLEAVLAETMQQHGDVLAGVERAVSAFRGERELFDDATMMTVVVG